MSDDMTVSNLQTHIRDLEQEIAETKRMVNRLLIRKGQPAMYADTAASAEVGHVSSIRTDQFYGQALSTAMREYLKMRKVANIGPATVHEIHDSLAKGGFAFETENEENRKRNIRISLTKNSALFHRLPNGTHFGLPDWYEEIAKRQDSMPVEKPKSKSKSKPKAKKPTLKPKVSKPGPFLLEHTESVKRVGDDEDVNVEESRSAERVTVKSALKEAVGAMEKEFTKQDLVDWIEKHHPTLKAEQRKSSIFSMIATMKKHLGLVTTSAGKGSEPHKFRASKAGGA